MLSPLPPELFDHIVDHLHLEYTTLKMCCLVSKSWVPRTRRHLFAHVDFCFPESIGLWMKVFPDPSNSPAHHTRTLHIDASVVTLMANSDTCPLVRSFHLVVAFSVYGWGGNEGFSGLVDLICSFSLLKDLRLGFLVLGGTVIGTDTWDTPSTSPKLNGSLSLEFGQIGLIIPRLLHLPGGLQFARIEIRYYRMRLDTPTKPIVLDLSKATKLKNIGIWSEKLDVQWITKSLQSIESKNLRTMKITLDPPSTLINQVGKSAQQELENLDRLLVIFWTSHSVLLTVKCEGKLSPKITSREGVHLLKCNSRQDEDDLHAFGIRAMRGWK